MQSLFEIDFYTGKTLRKMIRCTVSSDRDENHMSGPVVYIFKGKLHVPVIIVVIHVVTPVMHSEKIYESQVVDIFLVLRIMLKQNGNFEQLLEKATVYVHQENKYVYTQFSHTTKIKSRAIQTKLNMHYYIFFANLGNIIAPKGKRTIDR